MRKKEPNNIVSQDETNDEIKNNKTKNKSGNMFLRILKYVFITFTILGIIGASLAAGLIYGVVKDLKPVNYNNIYELLDQSSYIYDEEGQLIVKLHYQENRDIISIENIPKDIQNAFVAIEDERYYSHNGVDIRRLFGALVHDIKTMSKAQGASTITMQLAKNLYTSNDRSFTRKIKDLYYALQMEDVLSKDKILEAYLNTAALGRGTHGVQAASQKYFSKDVNELSIAESAMIAGVTKWPTKYSIYKTSKLDGTEDFSDIHRLKNNLIFMGKSANTPPLTQVEINAINKLKEHNIIDASQHKRLMEQKDLIRKAVLNPESKKRQETVLFKMHQLGYITDSEYQEAKNEKIIVNKGKEMAEDISSYFVDIVKNEVIDELVLNGFSKSEASDLLYEGGLRIYSTMSLDIQNILEKEYEDSKNFPGTFTDDNGNLQPQSSMVVMDNQTGQVKALIGGRNFKGSMLYNRATNPRQPGSAIKPLAVYLPAIKSGFSPSTIVDDLPMYNRSGQLWPKNWDNRYKGLTTVRELLRNSSNSGTVELAKMLGDNHPQSISIMLSTLEDLGFSTIVRAKDNKRVNDENFSLTLGGMSKGVTPLELTAAYSAIASEGVYTKPIFFTRVENSNGDVILQSEKNQKEIASKQEAYVITNLLEDVVNNGTGRRAKLKNMATAGKTGTTSAKKDAWFVGYSPYYTAATWIGVDSPKPLREGSKISAMLWKKVMDQIHSNLESKSFVQPTGIVRSTICTESGKLVTDICKTDPRHTVRSEIFIRGTQPKDYCTTHVVKEVNSDNGLLANEFTPIDKRVFKTFIQRTVPFIPTQGRKVPEDLIYQVPTVSDSLEMQIQQSPDGVVPSTNPEENNQTENQIMDEDNPAVDPWLMGN
ncbi:transglycosylase domain-containing protein [Peptostreptococcaceae bacterium AGR-M142]